MESQGVDLMFKSVGAMTKCIIVAVILCIIGVGILFYTTSRECESQLTRTKNVLMNNYDWSNFTVDTGNNAVPTLELAKLDISISNTPVFSTSTESSSLFDYLFNTSDELRIGPADIKFAIDATEIYNSFVIKLNYTIAIFNYVFYLAS